MFETSNYAISGWNDAQCVDEIDAPEGGLEIF